MPAALRLSLVHQTVLLLVTAVLLAVTALGGVVAWNLRSGFTDYLRAQDQDWLERFAQAAATAVAQDGLVALEGPSRSFDRLLLAAGPADQRDERPPRFDGRDRGPPRSGEPRDAPFAGGPPPRRLPPGAQRYANRLSVVTPEGRLLAGRPLPPGADAMEQPVRVDGAVVALLRLPPGPPPAQGVDAAFLARQYQGILLAAGGLMLLAAAGAVWVGRRWLRPVQEARLAAHRIAGGDLATRLVPRGHDELAGLAHDINAMAGALQQLEASRRRWIAELSHEMRTPLAVLRGEVECLIDGVRPTDAAALRSLHGEVARLTRLVEDFHQLALSDLRALPCTFVDVDVVALLNDAVARFATRAAAAGLDLALEVPPPQATSTAASPIASPTNSPTTSPTMSETTAATTSRVASPAVMARWDPQRVGQLLDNLLENSLRYTHAPGRVRLALVHGAGMARLTVDDSAPGVPPESQGRLFEPLFRADASRSRQSGGSGLGLAICQAIVRSHGGRIAAAASPLGGLRIEVQLPLRAEAALPLPAEVPLPQRAGGVA